MSGNPLVSVIMIFFNAARYVEEAIDSVFAQTYEHWELLLVDDGSTDGSTEIARRHAGEHHEKVRYLEHEGHRNRGMSAARNLGIRHARGEYIALLDADDVWMPPKLERQVAILSAQPEAAMVYGATQWWYSWTGSPEDSRRDFVFALGVPPDRLVQPPGLLPLFLRNEGASPCTCSVLIRREVVGRVGGFEEAFRGMYEDQAFFFKVCLKAPVYVSGECESRYRQHPGSCVSMAQDKGAWAARLSFLTWLEGYLTQQGIDDAEVWRALSDNVMPYRHPFLHRLRRIMGVLENPGPKPLMGGQVPVVAPFTGALRGGEEMGVCPTPPHAGVKPATTSKDEESRLHRRRGWDLLLQRAVTWRPTRDAMYGLVERSLRLPVLRHLRCLWFRRLHPLGNGRQRGTPIVRYHWARFLEEHRSDIRGRTLEIGTIATLRQFGGPAVAQAEAIDLAAHSPEVTVVADLSRADEVPSNTYDCFVNQFTMHLIHDVEAALYHSIRILKPGGVLLVNFPCLDYYFSRGLEMGTGAPLFLHWWFTPIQVENLLRRVGLAEIDYQMSVYGNLFARIAYQLNMPAEELTRREREYADPGHPLLIAVRAVKPINWQAMKPEYRDPWLPDTAPAWWNPATGHYGV